MKFKLFLLAIALHAVGTAQEKKYLAQVRLNDKFGYIDTSGKEVVPVIYDDVGDYGIIEDSGTWGDNLIPVNIGKSNPTQIEPPKPRIAIDPRSASDSIENSSLYIQLGSSGDEQGLSNGDGKWGYCNASGVLVIPTQFTKASPFSEGRAAVEIEGRWGYIDTAGKIVIPAIYEKAEAFSEGYAAVQKNDHYGYINTQGEEVIKFQYYSAGSFKNGCARVFEKNDRNKKRKDIACWAINKKGERVTSDNYDIESDFSDGLAVFSLSNLEPYAAVRYGIITTEGKILTPPIYDEIWGFTDGLAKVMVYKSTEDLREAYPAYGYINKQGKEVVKPKFATAEQFQFGITVVSEIDDTDDGWSKHALINTKGEFVLGFNWKYLRLIDSGQLWAIPLNDSRMTRITTKGKTLGSFVEGNLTDLGNGLFVETNLYGESIAFAGLNKKITIDLAKHSDKRFLSFQFGLIRFSEPCSNCDEYYAKSQGLMDLKGNVVTKTKYSEISDFEPTDTKK